MKRKFTGFTLIELLVVIAIIGLLSTLAVTALGGARTKARDARRLADVKQMQTALEMYYSDQTDYPAGADLVLGKNTLTTCLDSVNGFSGACAQTGTTYMGKVPDDPKPEAGTTEYLYNHTAGTNTYTLQYYLEVETQGLNSTWNTATEKGISE